MGEDSLRWRKLDDHVEPLLRQLLPPAEIIRSMAMAWTYAVTDPLLESDEDTFSRTGLKKLDLQKLGRNFLKAYWSDPTSDQPRPEARNQRKNAYLLGQQFARLFNVWIRRRLSQVPLSPRQLADLSWNLGVDLALLRQSDTDPPVKDGRLEVGTVRPVIRRRPDGQQKIELFVILLQETLVPLAEGLSSDQATGIPEGQTFKFCGGCTLLLDPIEGKVEYAIGKSGGRGAGA